MTKEQKAALAKEMLENMDLTKEQYMEMCRLCDELDLEQKEDEVPGPEDMSWDEILDNNNNS
jgi:hypothetical protein